MRDLTIRVEHPPFLLDWHADTPDSVRIYGHKREQFYNLNVLVVKVADLQKLKSSIDLLLTHIDKRADAELPS